MEIGLALAVPDLVALLVEPPLGLLADRGLRRRIVLGGGLVFAVALVGLSAVSSFIGLVLALALLYPASGAFVGLSQAALMDAAPAEQDRNMLRWTVAGSVGVLAGTLLIAAGLPWRLVIAAYALATLPLVVLARAGPELHSELREEPVRDVLAAAWRFDVLRWLVLLELEDIAGDLLAGFLALYFVDAAGADPKLAALAVSVWAAADLAGNLILVRMLGRLDGLRVIRVTAAAVGVLLPVFLLVPGTGAPKLAGARSPRRGAVVLVSAFAGAALRCTSRTKRRRHGALDAREPDRARAAGAVRAARLRGRDWQRALGGARSAARPADRDRFLALI